MNDMRKISLEDIPFAEAVIAVHMPYPEFVEKFGPKHMDHPPDWDAAGPVELWFFELPWGQRIILEYHLSIAHPQFNVYLGLLEINAVLDYLDLRKYVHYFNDGTLEILKKSHPAFTDGIGNFLLYRLDDNGNLFLMQTYESFRVADY